MPIACALLLPKDPTGPLNVVAMGRISTVHQNIENIEASHRYIQDYLGHIYQGPMQITLLGEQASGMLTDRATIREAEELVAGGKVDLMIAEDLARIYRNPRHQYRFVQDCVDMGTRVICVGDNLDTADENWEITMGAAALRHGLHIPDTRRRVRRTATHSFHKGGMVQKIRYGYRRLSAEDAASEQFGPKGLRIARRPECTPIIREMVDRVMRGDPYAAVADWLEAEGIEPGRYVEGRRWTARLVVELLDDPILSGMRTFRDTICRPIFSSGKHKPVKNTEPETEHCPELAHLSQEEHERLRQEIARRRALRIADTAGPPRRRGIPRSRTFWPGQAAVCGACGGPMYYSGKHLRCRNSLPRYGGSCWNHVQVAADIARERICGWLAEFVGDTPDLRQALVDLVWEEVDRPRRQAARNRPDPGREIVTLERQAGNLAAAIAEGGQLTILVEKLRGVEAALEKARATKIAEQDHIESTQTVPSKREIEQSLGKALVQLAASSFEFAAILRGIFPQFVIQPVQAIDSGQIRPRAKLSFRPAALLEGSGVNCEGHGNDNLSVTLDLFEPPAHIAQLPRCLAARETHRGLSFKGIAALLGIGHMTVKRAFNYARLMHEVGASEPYREVDGPPNDASRWRQRSPQPSGRHSRRADSCSNRANS
jgi:DNA invertase Pin-like site-specific DNA recombinase